MTQEEMCGRIFETLQVPPPPERRDDDDSSSIASERSSGVKDMIMRFERGLTNSVYDDMELGGDEYGEGSTSSGTPDAVNAIHTHLVPIFPDTSPGRTSTISVNSVLSGVSETSYRSESSATALDRRSDSDFGCRLIPSRPAPPPPEPFNDSDSSTSRSSIPDEDDEAPSCEKFDCTPPVSSPVVLRRARQPPVMRRKSLAESQKDLGVHWSYGVKQSDLEKLLRIRRRITDRESEVANGETDDSDKASGSDDVEDAVEQSDMDGEDARADAVSTDRSTDTLIDEGAAESDRSDSPTVASDFSERNVDNLSIRSISSLDMVPYQKYDSITVSSDEFGSEVCHAPDDEFLSVSAVNEWCVSKSSGPGVIPVETKKEKYRRSPKEKKSNRPTRVERLPVQRLRERVNELTHTESLYVEKLRHVVEDYMPELARPDVPPALRGLRFDIFANIDKMYRFHAEELLPDLRSCENDLKKLGQCFRRYEQKFHMYVIYSRNNKRASRLVYENKKFFQEKQIQLGERLDLSSYLLEPVQRIPRYKLFLDDLVKTYQSYDNERGETDSLRSKLSVESYDTGGSNGESSDCEETTLQSLQQAKAMIEALLTTVDDIIALENIRDCPINLLNQGKLLRQYEFLVTDPTRRRHNMRVFLFEKLVLLTVVYKKQLTVEVFLYRDHIPVDELGITPKEHDLLKFTIWYRKRNIKNYKLETAEPAVRAAWVEEITALLWKQAMLKKELQLRGRSARNSTISVTSQQSSDGDLEPAPSDKYNSLRGVPGEVRRANDKKCASRRTTWYYE